MDHGTCYTCCETAGKICCETAGKICCETAGKICCETAEKICCETAGKICCETAGKICCETDVYVLMYHNSSHLAKTDPFPLQLQNGDLTGSEWIFIEDMQILLLKAEHVKTFQNRKKMLLMLLLQIYNYPEFIPLDSFKILYKESTILLLLTVW